MGSFLSMFGVPVTRELKACSEAFEHQAFDSFIQFHNFIMLFVFVRNLFPFRASISCTDSTAAVCPLVLCNVYPGVKTGMAIRKHLLFDLWQHNPFCTLCTCIPIALAG